MELYKRNQVEEAISAVLDSQSRPSSELRTRIKRLLETDRALGRDVCSNDLQRANFAFYSGGAPGSGVEVWFSEYEGFALVLGLKLMAHGWSQSFAVSVMRRVRLELENQHARVLRLDKKELFDQVAIRREAREGDFAFDNRDPVLLTIVSKPGARPAEQSEPHACAVCRGPHAALKFASDFGRGSPWTMVEVTTIAHAFSQRLACTKPRHRGRA